MFRPPISATRILSEGAVILPGMAKADVTDPKPASPAEARMLFFTKFLLLLMI
jgi:hypothetical protein